MLRSKTLLLKKSLNIKILLTNTQDNGFHIFCFPRILQHWFYQSPQMHFKSLPLNWSSVVRSVPCVKSNLESKCSERNLRLKIFSKLFKIYVYDMCEITSGVKAPRKKLSDKGRSLPTFSLFQPMDKKSKSIVIEALILTAPLLCELTFMRH